ncbi:LysM peptidoglycan-binding domain-containing protein [Enterococcus thailandicus]|uniref:LysM peptidoglycan-binding domain-containing protein n=1 Tax=Enterococcus thailandicus TaxID=417368 RepID=UPI003BE1FCA0
MKKILGGSLLFLSLLFFAACGKNITTEDLKANDWLIEATKNDEPNIIASFTDNVVSFSVDARKMKSTASNEWEAAGEDFVKKLVEEVSYEFEYTLKNDEMVWKDKEDKDNDAKYTISKDEKNLILTPDKNNKSNDNEKLTLKPYKKKKNTKTKETTKTSSEKSSGTTAESSTQSSIKTSSNTETSMSTSAAVTVAENSSTNYQKILDEYTAKIQNATPNLIQEFKNEAASNTGGIDGLAAISNNKVEKLAMISNEGIGKMADLHYSLSDEYSTYETWATKLTDIYTVESQKIVEEYLAYSSSQSNTSAYVQSSKTPQDSSSSEATSQEPSVSTTTIVQVGEGPKQIAERAGITVDQLFQLNGMDPNNYMMYPGQELRIK